MTTTDAFYSDLRDVPGYEPPSLFRRYSMSELLAADRTFRWTVRGMLVHPTYGMLGGEKKSFKTYVGTMIDIGIATGIPILGRFSIDRPGPVVVYMGEGGRVPYTRRLERIAAAMGVTLDDAPLNLSFDTAGIGSVRFGDSLRRDLDQIEPVLVHIDPLYSYHPEKVNASNLFEEGAMLANLSSMCLANDASCILTTHFNKTGSGAGLDRLTQAGGQEWSDTWFLLAHRGKADVARGLFKLTLEIGSRQWGGSTWNLDLDVGRFDEDLGEFDGSITWDLHRAGATPDSVLDRVVALVLSNPGMFTREEIGKKIGGNATVWRQAINDAVTRGQITPSTSGRVRQNGRPMPVTVYGPATAVAPGGTDAHEGSELPRLSLVTNDGTSVPILDGD
jgi:hypothetical protein